MTPANSAESLTMIRAKLFSYTRHAYGQDVEPILGQQDDRQQARSQFALPISRRLSMVTVIFEVIPKAEGRAEYLSIAAKLRERLAEMPGFISIERFQSLTNPEKVLSLSFWEDETAVKQWRNLDEHRVAQAKGRGSLFKDYRIRVGSITRDYSMSARGQTPQDSRKVHDS